MGVQKVRDDLYLIEIDRLCDRSGSELAKTGQIAERLGVTVGSASTKLKQLATHGLIVHQQHKGAKLTEDGRNRVSNVLRRVRVIEMWLAISLNLEREYLAEEALRLESAASERLVEAIDSALGQLREVASDAEASYD